MDIQSIVDQAENLVAIYGLRVIGALVILIVGRWVAKGIRSLIRRMMAKYKTDATLSGFTQNLVYYLLMAFIWVAALNQVGVQTASFIAIVGAAGLAVGLAMQGSLSNFAAGFLIILFKPIRVGDYIEAGGTAGSVEEIQIFTTVLKSPDNKKIIVPNSKILGDNIVNYSALGTRRVDIDFGIGYDDDVDKARGIILAVAQEDERFFKDPEPVVLMKELADSSVNLAFRAWSNAGDYWPAYFSTMEKVKKLFDQEGITIPYPQRDVHIYNETKETV